MVKAWQRLGFKTCREGVTEVDNGAEYELSHIRDQRITVVHFNPSQRPEKQSHKP